MTEFKDKIRAAGGKVEFLYDPAKGIAAQISGSGFIAVYLIAVSLDGRHLLATVPATGIGQTPVYPQPSVLTYIQSDELGMWGRNCPACQKYFRTNHVMGVTFCPYCSLELTRLCGAPTLPTQDRRCSRIFPLGYYPVNSRGGFSTYPPKDHTPRRNAWRTHGDTNF